MCSTWISFLYRHTNICSAYYFLLKCMSCSPFRSPRLHYFSLNYQCMTNKSLSNNRLYYTHTHNNVPNAGVISEGMHAASYGQYNYMCRPGPTEMSYNGTHVDMWYAVYMWCPDPEQGLQNRPVRSNRRPPVAVYRTDLTGNWWNSNPNSKAHV